MIINFKHVTDIPSPGLGAKLAFDGNRLALARGSVLKIGNLDGFFDSYRFPGYQLQEVRFTQKDDCVLVSPYIAEIDTKSLRPDNMLIELKEKLYKGFQGTVEVTVATHSPKAIYVALGLQCRPPKGMKRDEEATEISNYSSCVVLIEAQTGKLISKIDESHFPYSAIAISDTHLAVASIEGSFLLDISSGDQLVNFVGKSKIFKRLQFSEDGCFLVCGGLDGQIMVWDILAKKQKAIFSTHEGEVTGLSFHPTLNVLLTCGNDSHCRVWDLDNTSNCLAELKLSGPVSEIALSSSGDSVALVTGSFGNTIEIHKIQVRI
ncbi:WD40 repeat domain-containing protein [Aquimarina algiphila]|uniref:WD40 repeat domain-containing protein n=1 Tax=Aquimarina algiphila TaxID=2047982 RepID=UPI00232EF1A8|nr:hypothetical protein [Aquimarina algiphila]